MTDIIDLLVFEEGFRSRPYLDTEGFPTVGIGFLLAKRKCTKGELKEFYNFELPLQAAEAWLEVLLRQVHAEMMKDAGIRAAYTACANAHPTTGWDTNPRIAVLLSMAYQLGVSGLAKFTTTLGDIAAGRFAEAADAMLKSKWAKQTPNRAGRHSGQMYLGKWDEEYPG